MKTQRLHVVAALTLGLGMLALVVVTLSVASAPSISHASSPGQMGNPCGYGFQINVVPALPTTNDTVSVTYSAEWSYMPTPEHQSYQVMGNVIRLDAVYYVPEVGLPVIAGWGGEAGVGSLPSGTYTVQVYLTTVMTPTVFPPELCGIRSFTVYEEPQQAPADLYVARTGVDSGDCTDSDFPCRTVQYAVDQASEGSAVKVASGIYTDLNVRPRDDLTTTGLVTQVVYISKTVTIRGGYTTTNWSVSHPISFPTILDARGQGRVLYVTGASAPGAGISPVIEGLRITGGDSAGLGGRSLRGEAGGGIYVITAKAAISGCQVVTNTANRFIPYGGDGGGIYLRNSPNATLKGNTIQDNEAWYGGGVYLYSSNNVTLIGNTVQDNGAYGWYGAAGGGVFLQESANTILTGNIIQGNVTQVGGGVFLIGSHNVTLTNNTILSNTAVGSHTFFEGGGISARFSNNATLIGNVIRGNEGEEGGGICLLDSHNATLDNNVIADNQSWTNGGGIYVAGGTAYLRHTTLARNTGDSGLYIAGWSGVRSIVAMTNTILLGHTVGITVAAGSTATLESTLWGSGVWANTTDWGGSGLIVTGTSAHNYWGDPAFVNSSTGDYHINSASAAFNAGIDAGVTEDIDGDPRSDGHPDIGADELQAALRVTKHAYPSMVQPGERLTYTIRITNAGSLDLCATIMDTLPFSVTLGGTLSGTALLPGRTVVLPGGMVGITWTAFITAPGGVWMETVVVTVDADYTGPLTNVVKVTTEEGATGVYTETSTAIISGSVYLPLVMRNAFGATAIVGEYLLVGNPCTTDPCLPGMVYAVLENDATYYPTVEGAWLWSNHSWNGYTPEIGDFVAVIGYVEEMMDIFGNPFYDIEVTSLEPAPQPPAATWNVVISDVLSYGVGDQDPGEYVEIRNDDTQPIQLDGWTLRNASGRVFAFPNYSMQPGQVCRIYTNEDHPEWCGFSYSSEWDVWNYANDCAYLRDSTGTLIDVYCYCQSHTAFMTISSTATTLAVGDVVTVTTTLFNRGCTGLGMPQYRLYIQSDEPEPIFDPSNPEPVVHYLAVGLGQSDAEEFVLQAVQPGQATLRTTTSFEVHLGYPGPAYWGNSGSGPLMITVTP